MRVPGESDIPLAAALMSEHAPERVSEADVAREWSAPYIVLERDARIEDDGHVMVETIDSERAWLGVYGRPSKRLLDWADAESRERAARVLSGGWSTDELVLRALRERGFEHVRSSHRMLLDLTRPGAAAEWPPRVAVGTFEEGDERTFYALHQETFRDMWEPIEDTYEEWAHFFLEPPAFAPELWFLAHDGDEPAGIAICSPHETRAETGWVRVLGVRRAWRRRGLGRALLLHAFEEFRRRGFTTAGLGVDAASETGANRLYESLGMRTAARFDILERSA